MQHRTTARKTWNLAVFEQKIMFKSISYESKNYIQIADWLQNFCENVWQSIGMTNHIWKKNLKIGKCTQRKNLPLLSFLAQALTLGVLFFFKTRFRACLRLNFSYKMDLIDMIIRFCSKTAICLPVLPQVLCCVTTILDNAFLLDVQKICRAK